MSDDNDYDDLCCEREVSGEMGWREWKIVSTQLGWEFVKLNFAEKGI